MLDIPVLDTDSAQRYVGDASSVRSPVGRFSTAVISHTLSRYIIVM